MEELLKQTEADIAEVKKTIRRLRFKRAKTKHTSELYAINKSLLEAESMLSDLIIYKAQIEDYIKTRSDSNA